MEPTTGDDMHWEQVRLPALAPESISISANHFGRDGWSVSVGVRRQLEAWEEVSRDHYDHLSAGELVDVIYAALYVSLGRPDDGC